MSLDTLDSNMDLSSRLDGKLFMGTVTANVDPLGLDRIKVSVPGLYEPDKGEVPWAGPIKLSSFGFSNDHGVYGSPQVGDDVVILLQGGDQHYPMYHSIQRYGSASTFPSGKSWGFRDPIGNKLKVDLTTGKISFETSDGIRFNTDGNGSVTIHIPGGQTIDVDGHLELTADSITANADQVTMNTQDMYVSGNLRNGATMKAGNGASGTFTAASGQIVTVQDGIVTNIT